MLKSQNIQIKMSEIREQINGLADDAAVEDVNSLTGQYQALEAQYRAALIVEGEEVRAAGEVQGQGQEGESAEVRKLPEAGQG